jgi:hypothetical protein
LDAELSRSLVQQEQQVNGYDRVIGTDSIPHSAFRIPGLAMGVWLVVLLHGAKHRHTSPLTTCGNDRSSFSPPVSAEHGVLHT